MTLFPQHHNLINSRRCGDTMRAIGLFFLAAVLASASAADLEFDEYVQRGNAAQKRGDWESAASQFAQALNHADLPNDDATRSAMNLEYGRAMGVLCHYREAEKYLLRAKAFAESAKGSLFRPLYELGAVSLAQKKYVGAAIYFAAMEREAREKLSPWLVADALEKTAAAMAASGRSVEASSRLLEADRIRDARPPAPPPGTITPHGAQCP